MVRIRTLLDLLGSVVALLSMAPVLAFLDRPIAVMAFAALGIGAWCDWQGRPLMPTWLANLVGLVAVGVYALQVTREDVATPVVNALVVLLAIRLLNPKQGRDYLQIFVLGLFILAGSTLISLEVGFILYLVLLVFAVTIGLVLLTVFVSDEQLVLSRGDLGKLLRVSLLLPVVSLLLMMLFFLILPRTQHPLWTFLNPKLSAETGLSETVRPGSFASISAMKNLAFRAEAPPLAPEDLYWRALVLNRPQGEQWIRSDPPHQGASRLLGGRPFTLTVFPEPRTDQYLITLDRPALLSGVRHEVAVDQTYKSRFKIDHRLRYEVVVHPGAVQQVFGALDENFYLQAPQVSERIRALAQDLVKNSADRAERLAALADFFRNRQLRYAEDDLPSGPDILGQFLFDSKRGYCEFFASAYVTLARLTGIPARLVGGYLGGEYNPMGGYYLVTEDRAHVWAEVLTEQQQWTRVDPSQWAVNAETTIGRRQSTELKRLQQLIDSLNYHWVQVVVVFDLARQIEVFREARSELAQLKKPRLPQRPPLIPVLLVGCTVVGYLWWRRSRVSVEARLLRQFRQRVRRRYGREAFPEHSGLSELAEGLADARCREFARIYHAAIFRDRKLQREDIARLRRLIREL